MSESTHSWLLAGHVVGVILWIGGLAAVLALLTVHPKVDAASRAALTAVERTLAIVTDAGATLAIALGLWLALGVTPTEFGHGGWLHIKLTAVVLGVLSAHGMARVKIKKFKNGDVKPLPSWIWITFAVAVAIAATLGANQTLMR